MFLRLIICSIAFFSSWCSATGDTFVYDDAGRLSSATQANGLNYSYPPDEESNLLSATHTGTDTTDTGGAGNRIQDWWENYWFGARGIDPLATPAGDGISTLVKYALGRNPLVSGSGAVTASYQNYNGQNYPFLTYIRSRDAATTVGDFLEQSSDMVSWFSGSLYFAAPTVADLGDGTERVTVRALTALPSAANLHFRLRITGTSGGATGYFNIPAAPAVPALSFWILVCLAVLVPVVASRFLRSRLAAH